MGEVFVTSSIEGINKMLGGGYPKDILVGIMGAPKSGKSIFALQEAYHFMAEHKKSVLWFSTEPGATHLLRAWDRRFRGRFKVPENCRVILLEETNIENILKMHGIRCKVRYSGKGKAIMTLYGRTSMIPVGERIKDNKVGMVVYDSVSNPLKLTFAGRENFPERAKALTNWLDAMYVVRDKYDVFIMTIHHHRRDPAGEQPLGLVGGETLEYNVKCLWYLERVMDKDVQSLSKLRTLRKISLARWFDVEDWSQYTYVLLKDDGYTEITPAELKDIIATFKKKRKKTKAESEEEEVAEEEEESE